jgi:septin family protein
MKNLSGSYKPSDSKDNNLTLDERLHALKDYLLSELLSDEINMTSQRFYEKYRHTKDDMFRKDILRGWLAKEIREIRALGKRLKNSPEVIAHKKKVLNYIFYNYEEKI